MGINYQTAQIAQEQVQIRTDRPHSLIRVRPGHLKNYKTVQEYKTALAKQGVDIKKDWYEGKYHVFRVSSASLKYPGVYQKYTAPPEQKTIKTKIEVKGATQQAEKNQQKTESLKRHAYTVSGQKGKVYATDRYFQYLAQQEASKNTGKIPTTQPGQLSKTVGTQVYLVDENKIVEKRTIGGKTYKREIRPEKGMRFDTEKMATLSRNAGFAVKKQKNEVVITKPIKVGYSFSDAQIEQAKKKKVAERVVKDATIPEAIALHGSTLLSGRGYKYIGSWFTGETEDVVKSRAVDIYDYQKGIQYGFFGVNVTPFARGAVDAIGSPVVEVETAFLGAAGATKLLGTKAAASLLAKPIVKGGLYAAGTAFAANRAYEIYRERDTATKIGLALTTFADVGAGFAGTKVVKSPSVSHSAAKSKVFLDKGETRATAQTSVITKSAGKTFKTGVESKYTITKKGGDTFLISGKHLGATRQALNKGGKLISQGKTKIFRGKSFDVQKGKLSSGKPTETQSMVVIQGQKKAVGSLSKTISTKVYEMKFGKPRFVQGMKVSSQTGALSRTKGIILSRGGKVTGSLKSAGSSVIYKVTGKPSLKGGSSGLVIKGGTSGFPSMGPIQDAATKQAVAATKSLVSKDISTSANIASGFTSGRIVSSGADRLTLQRHSPAMPVYKTSVVKIPEAQTEGKKVATITDVNQGQRILNTKTRSKSRVSLLPKMSQDIFNIQEETKKAASSIKPIDVKPIQTTTPRTRLFSLNIQPQARSSRMVKMLDSVMATGQKTRTVKPLNIHTTPLIPLSAWPGSGMGLSGAMSLFSRRKKARPSRAKKKMPWQYWEKTWPVNLAGLVAPVKKKGRKK